MTRDPWRGLALRVGIGAAVAVVAVIVGPLLALRIHPGLAIAAGVTVGAVVWGFTGFLGPTPGPAWERPYWRERSAFLQADSRTRRLAHALKHAQPGEEFEARRVAQRLRTLTEERLIATRRTPADDPLAHAGPHLSPALLRYLRSADAERPQALNRKTLHAHLQEIDSL